MFTGIIEAVGEIKHVAPLEKGKSLSITSGLLDLSDTKIGDSIAVNGSVLPLRSRGVEFS
jgi:riboflavin synthase